MEKKASITHIQQSFKRFLSINSNNRIIFSGPFGTGKTFFLNSFFENNDKYLRIIIRPVKYSVGSNQDIIEYMKFDILQQLYLKNRENISQDEKFSHGIKAWAYLNNNYKKIIEDLIINSISILESKEIPIIKPIAQTIKDAYEGYKKYSSKIDEESKSMSEIAESYFDANTKIRGSIFEDDIITQTIRGLIALEKSNLKETVLLIDDFDRIEPEHIFRILNILSSHDDFHNTKNENKFGFDKIIIVCDIDIIENYYSHKYGVNSNFDGYIDKFCSKYIYRFQNDEAVKKFSKELIYKMKSRHDNDLKVMLVYILNTLLSSGFINIRNLTKLDLKYSVQTTIVKDDIELPMEKLCPRTNYIATDKICIDNQNMIGLDCLMITSSIIGDFQKMIRYFKECNSSSIVDESTAKVFIKHFSIINHIAMSENERDLVFRENKQMDHDCSKIHIVYPNFNFAGVVGDINLKWTTENKYSGNNNLYDGANVKVHSKPIKLASENLFSSLANISEFLKSNNLIFNL